MLGSGVSSYLSRRKIVNEILLSELCHPLFLRAPGRSILSNIRRGWKWVTHVFKTRNDSDLPAPFCEGAGVLCIAIENRNERWHFNNVLFGSLLLSMAVVQTLFLGVFFSINSQQALPGHKTRFMLEWVSEGRNHLFTSIVWIAIYTAHLIGRNISHILRKGKISCLFITIFETRQYPNLQLRVCFFPLLSQFHLFNVTV